MATALDPFSMFMLTTGPAFLRDDESIINAVVKNSYLLPRFMEGKETELLLQGGSKIQDILYLSEDSDAEFYSAANQDFDYRNQQVGTAWEINWRFLKNSTAWTDHEVGLNESGGLSDRIGRFHRFKRIQRLKYMNLWTTQIHKMEDALTATPNREAMEEGNGLLPQSLFCFITGPGNISGTSNPGVPNLGLSATAWTEVQKINVAQNQKWRNQTAAYVITAVASTILAENWWQGMRELHSKVRFERLPRFGSYSDPNRSPAFYAVSLWGLIACESAMRSPQDILLAGRQDPAYPAPMFQGVPFVYVSNLNGAVVWNSQADVTKIYNEQATAAVGGAVVDTDFLAGPRVTAINGAVVNMVMHRDRVIHRLPPFSPDRQPFTKVLVTDTWYNVACRNRRELGVLGPIGTTNTFNVAVPAAPSVGV